MAPREEDDSKVYELTIAQDEDISKLDTILKLEDVEFGNTGSNLGQLNKKHTNEQPRKLSGNELILFGFDISHMTKMNQFVICASGVIFFTIIYGYLQELITVHVACRNFGVFLASLQFAGYAFWSSVLNSLRPIQSIQKGNQRCKFFDFKLPAFMCLGLSVLKALELGLTYLALQYVNYPAKTLIKSSRVVFTMFLGVVISGKRYKRREYVNVFMIVTGLAIFLHADSKVSPIFHPMGVIMLASALLCDGLLSNFSEVAMNTYEIGHDAFQLQISSVGCITLAFAAYMKGELFEALHFFTVPGTYDEIQNSDTPSYSVAGKVLIVILFSSFGLFGASCAGAITKTHGAFYMSLTTTSRKALSLMVSFVAFPNACTHQHLFGIAIFMSALIRKSVQAKIAFESKHQIKTLDIATKPILH